MQKQIFDVDKKINLSFLKEYLEVFEINKIDIAILIQCNKMNIDDILDGKILISEYQFVKICRYFDVSDYVSLKNKLNKRIEIKRKVEKENKLFGLEDYIFDERDYEFVYKYYKVLDKEGKKI